MKVVAEGGGGGQGEVVTREIRELQRLSDIAPMPDAVAERTLPHNLEAERSVLGAILLHNDAFNLAAEVIDSGDFFRDAHRRIFDKMVKLVRARRRHRSRHAQGGARTLRRSRRGRRPGLHRGARRRRAALDQRRALRADHQGEGDAPQPDLLRQQDSSRRRTRPRKRPTSSSTRPSTRSSRSPTTRSATGSCRCATWRSRASTPSRSCTRARSSSPACRPASPISTR